MGYILIVDDERDIRELLADILQDEGFSTRLAAESDTTFELINESSPDLIILDIWLKYSKLDGIKILKKVHANNPDIPIVIISGHGNVEIAVAAIKQGAYDFIEKPFNIDQLMVTITRAMEASRLRRENLKLRIANETSSVMIGKSLAFKTMMANLDKVTQSNARVMLTGASGVGKEVAARYIHAHSPRSKGRFIVINCASIKAERMESLLFGRASADGSYKSGLLEQAHQGVIFFDEVADMPFATQAKIMHIFFKNYFTRLNGKNRVRVNFRILSATNKDLELYIKANKFRQDLYHRLNVIPIAIPTLEERQDDIPLLAQYFISEFNHLQGLPKRTLSTQAISKLKVRSFPGNLRQLRNIIERILILGPESGQITAEELDRDQTYSIDLLDRYKMLSLREARELFECEYLDYQFKRFGANISKIAGFIGMERSALYRKIKTLNLSINMHSDRTHMIGKNRK